MIQPHRKREVQPVYLLNLALGLVLLLTFIFTVFPLKNYDIFWHLKAGDLIRVTRDLPQRDIFSHTSPNLRWELTSWGSDVVFSFIYRFLGGESGIIYFKALLVVLAYGFLIATLKKRLARSLVLLPGFWLFSLMVAKESLLVRPQVFTYLFLAIYYYLLDYYRRPVTGVNLRLLLAFPLIMAVWSNCHPGFAVGYLLLFTFLCFETIKYVLRNHIYNKWGIERLLTGKKLLGLWFTFPLVILATAANPYGINTLLAPLKLFAASAQTNMILEWSPPLLNEEPLFFAAVFFLGAIILFAFRLLDLSDLGIFLLFTLMALKARRFIAEFALISFPIAYRYCEMLVHRLRAKYGGKLQITAVSQPMIVIVFMSGMLAGLLVYGGRLSTAQDVDRYPGYASDFIIHNEISGNMFNTFRWGGYLIHRLYPRIKTFVDGRLLSRRVFKDYIDVVRVSPDWEDILKLYNVDIALTSHWFETGERFLINDALLESNDWVRVFDDNKSQIFLRNIPRYQDIIKKYSPLYLQKHPQEFKSPRNPHQYIR